LFHAAAASAAKKQQQQQQQCIQHANVSDDLDGPVGASARPAAVSTTSNALRLTSVLLQNS
jgi:hypothetical protein